MLTKGVIYTYGRDKRGFPNIWVDYKKADTSKSNIEFTKEA